ncbi:MAG: DUF2442 domain-containing protein, partial [Candidatus Latescibacterota bacterium]
MSGVSAPRQMAVVVQDREVAQRLPRGAGLRRFAHPTKDLLERYRDVFVAVPLLGLPALADFIRQANNRHYLRALFVRDEGGSQLLPQLLAQANLRTVRNLMVHSDAELPARVLNAYRLGVEDELIAYARLVRDQLFVITCAGEVLTLTVAQVPRLKDLGPDALAVFEVAEDGSYLHWPAADLHMDVESVRALLDPARRAQQQMERVLTDRQLGTVVAALRREHGLTQAGIPGLSEREVRRIERGQRARMRSLGHLAAAHG